MSQWAPNAYINRLYERSRRTARIARPLDAKGRQESRERLKQILGIDPASADELAPVVLERVELRDHIRERVEIGTRDGLRMPLYVLLPKGREYPRPAVLALHGHGYGSRELVGLGPDGSSREEGDGIHKHFALSLVRRGFVAVVPELIGFGERRLTEDAEANTDLEDLSNCSCYKLSSYLIHLGHNLAGIRTHEVLRALDYALTREEIRKRSIGSMGLSGGAFVGYLSGAVDERIKAAVLSGYPNTYEDSYYFSKQHCLCDYVPGIVELGDMPDLIGLIAPRAVYLEAGRDDPLFPLSGVQAAAAKLRSLYEALDAADRFGLDIFEGKHEVSGAHAFDWLSGQLQGER